MVENAAFGFGLKNPINGHFLNQFLEKIIQYQSVNNYNATNKDFFFLQILLVAS